MNVTSHKVAKSFHVVNHLIGDKVDEATITSPPVNHVAVIDCSGSMYYDLPHIREQLKRRIPKLLGEKDTLSVIWFSGRGQYGTLIEAEPVSTLADLQDVNRAIDRWLKPVGLTGFKEPMQEVGDLISRVGKKNKNPFALFFMSDGCDNCSVRSSVLEAASRIAGGLSSSTFVEYGHWADRPLLTAMAEKTGGTLIFSENFDRYVPIFEGAIQRTVSGAPRIEVEVKTDVIGGFAFAVVNGELYSYEVSDGKVSVPEDLPELWYLSLKAVGVEGPSVADVSKKAAGKKKSSNDLMDAAYAAVSLFSLRMQPKVVYPLLKAIGDVRFIEEYGGCFGKQKYTQFMEEAKKAAFGEGRFVDGRDPKRVPKANAFTILDLLNLLVADDKNCALLDSDDFKYKRISRARLDASENLTADEAAEIEKLSKSLARTKDVEKVKEIQARIAAITDSKGPVLKFVATPAPNGYPVGRLTFNETRPNVSIQVKKHGTVDLSKRLTEDQSNVPAMFNTFVYRNYAIIQDGVVNVDVLPVAVTTSTYEKLVKAGVKDMNGRVPASADAMVQMNIDLRKIPVINQRMVQDVSAETLFRKVYELTQARAAQKVFNSVKKEKFPRESKGFKELYGAESAAWLKEQGITDYSGFQPPKTTQAESTDYYVAKELKVSLKGLSSIPSLKDARKRIASGKVTPSAALMVPTIEEIDEFLASSVHKKAFDGDRLFETWLDDKLKEVQKTVRRLLFETSQIRFGVIMGQTWFTDLPTLDDTTLTFNVGGVDIVGTVQMVEKQVNI